MILLSMTHKSEALLVLEKQKRKQDRLNGNNNNLAEVAYSISAKVSVGEALVGVNEGPCDRGQVNGSSIIAEAGAEFSTRILVEEVATVEEAVVGTYERREEKREENGSRG